MKKTRADPGSRKTSIVIPYYQEQPGILREAVLSAILQEGVTDLEIIVVDDGSPAPARDDLEGLDLPAHVTLKLVEQSNRGPGAARNRALDSVSPEAVYVAFLDSDDRWSKSHLINALRVLEAGYDIYFSDFWWSRHEESVFSRHGLQLCRHTPIASGASAYRYLGEAGRELIGPLNCIFLQTVVYRFQHLHRHRFLEQFHAGEDRIFLLQLLTESNRLVFSAEVECYSARGVHISEESGWGSQRHIWKLYHEMGWRKLAEKEVDMKPIDKLENRKQIRKLRISFGMALLHGLRRMHAFRDANVLRFAFSDPACLLSLFRIVFDLLLKHYGLGGRMRGQT